MRIISGQYKGRHIPVPSRFKARPTTDFAREGLFNVLANNFDFDTLRVLDLFGGTGSISLEFASRGARMVDCVEMDNKKCQFVKKTVHKIGIITIRVHRGDALKFIRHPAGKYELIFADPPYDMDEIPEIPKRILDSGLLEKDGWLILEHGSQHSFSGQSGFRELRKYGSVHFSIFS